MKKTLIVSFSLLFSVVVFSQTKKIAHRSHSGKDNSLIMTTEDNFGLPNPNYKKVDTTTVKKDTAAKVPATKRTVKRKKKHIVSKINNN